MIGATEFYATTPGLNAILWVEAVIYLSIGAYELLDDFAVVVRPGCRLISCAQTLTDCNTKLAGSTSGLCFVLGMVALNGAIEGVVTRFELELIFISFAVILPVLWATLLPGRLGITVLLLKPEFWLQGLMLIFYSDLIRTEILWLCIALNLWGIVVYFLAHSEISPYEYATLRRDVIAAEGEAAVVKCDKLAGNTAAKTTSNPSLDSRS